MKSSWEMLDPLQCAMKGSDDSNGSSGRVQRLVEPSALLDVAATSLKRRSLLPPYPSFFILIMVECRVGSKSWCRSEGQMILEGRSMTVTARHITRSSRDFGLQCDPNPCRQHVGIFRSCHFELDVIEAECGTWCVLRKIGDASPYGDAMLKLSQHCTHVCVPR